MTVALETKVEIAFTSGFSTPEGSRVWTDVSQWVEDEVSITYGRSDELSAPEPSRASLTFDNLDGRFTPGLATSPYSPNIKKGKPVRVSVRYNGGAWSIRFTGYIDEWPLVWPDGTEHASSVTVSATSRTARLGVGAPLPSAIRDAYLATNPTAYYPMDDDPAEHVFTDGSPAFLDIKKPAAIQYNGAMGLYYDGKTTVPTNPARVVYQQAGEGPNDELGLVRFPSFTGTGARSTYVGGTNRVSVGRTGAFTMECVARVIPVPGASFWSAVPMQIQTNDGNWVMLMAVNGYPGTPQIDGVDGEMMYRSPTSSAVLDDQVSAYPTLNGVPGVPTPAASALAANGKIHHFAMTLTGGNVGKFYLDGVLIQTLTLTTPYVFNRAFTDPVIGGLTYNATTWVGHVAFHDRALTPAEITAHSSAAISVDETLATRVQRVASHAGVPAGEIDVEPSLAIALGYRGEKDRSAVEVLNEIAASTGGILYDDRGGRLVMQARNHRYNEAVTFTLSAKLQEIQGDLTAVLDDRYLANRVEVTLVDFNQEPIVVTDQPSIDAYGVYATSYDVVTSHYDEGEALALSRLSRYAEPKVRVSQVSVDVANLSSAQRALVLAADIGSRFAVKDLPKQAPEDPLTMFFEGCEERISPTSHTLQINTTPAPDKWVKRWVLGSSTLSVLGSTTTPAY